MPRSVLITLISFCLLLTSCRSRHDNGNFVFDRTSIATTYFGEDKQWYIDNVPFFECSDKDIEKVYYYRWKLYKAHLRNTAKDSFVVTEFINHVPWDLHPYCTINAASMHHIYEGRWLRNDRYINAYLNYLTNGGGNNRKYSESIADATYASYLVNMDSSFVFSQLQNLQRNFDAWYDHYDNSKNMYFIPAMPDATEYTIASIDASGGKDGFEGGDAFRPTINSYMFGNARAIEKIAALRGDHDVESKYRAIADSLRYRTNHFLWNDSLKHFTDRFKVDNQYVKYWSFIRGRELAGMVPWYFNLPEDIRKFSSAWEHVLDTMYLLGQFGFRTNEPAYEYYFKQFVFFDGKRGSQWNGPSWPFQSSLVLTGMANLLHNYRQHAVTSSDYFDLLKRYARQHFLTNDSINLVENYDPNLGGPIVHYYWSNHYNHSSFNNLIISGMCGIIPSASDTLIIDPLIDTSVSYFLLDNIKYHGNNITVMYDRNGTRYGYGKGLSVYVNNEKENLFDVGNKKAVLVPLKANISRDSASKENHALNIALKGYPRPSASVNANDTSTYQAIDGRVWFFPEITNYWSTRNSKADSSWFSIEFRDVKQVSQLRLFLFSDYRNVKLPDSIIVEYSDNGAWKTAKSISSVKYVANTASTIEIIPIRTKAVRLKMKHTGKEVAIAEVECY